MWHARHGPPRKLMMEISYFNLCTTIDFLLCASKGGATMRLREFNNVMRTLAAVGRRPVALSTDLDDRLFLDMWHEEFIVSGVWFV